MTTTDALRRPMTALEHGLWIATASRPSPRHVLPLTITFTGPLDTVVLATAVERVLDAHPELRSHVDTGDETATIVVPDSPTLVEVVPVEDGPYPESAAAVQTFLWDTIDPRVGPLARARIFRASADHHVVALVGHHLVIDGVSKSILVDELLRVLADPAVVLDTAETGGGWSDEELDAARSFWAEHATGLGSLVDPFPADGGTVLRVRSGERDATRLADVAERIGVTRFAVMHALVRVALARVGVDVTGIGLDVSARRPAERDRVGMLVNQMVVDGQLDERRTFARFAFDLGERTRRATAHRHVPFARARGIRPTLGESIAPVTLSYRQQRALRDLPNLTVHVDWASTPPIPRNAIHVQVVDAKDALDLTVHATDAALGPDRTRALSDTILALLRALATNPDQCIRSLSGAEAPPTFGIGGSPVDETPVVNRIRTAVDRDPGAVAVSCGGETLTYAELGARVGALVARLRAAGVGRGDVVGVGLGRSVDAVVGAVAAMAVGGVYLPLDPAYPAARSAMLLETSGAHCVVVDEGSAQSFPVDYLHVPVRGSGDDGFGSVADWGPGPVLADAAYLIFTSGSTGTPKGVLVGHAGLANRLAWMVDALSLNATDVVAQKTSVGFDVSVWELLLAPSIGGRVVVSEAGGHRDPGYLHEWVDDAGVSVMHFVPSMLVEWLEADSGPHPGLRMVICSGEALPASVAERFRARYPHVRLLNLYGPTEASIDVTWHEVGDIVGDGVGGVPIGTPIAGTRIHILDRWGHPVPVGVSGELHIAGVGLAAGYVGDPRATAARFLPDPFGPPGSRMYASGDLARWDQHGTLTYLGRIDQQLKHHGFRIEPGEIETHLTEHPGVAHAVVGLAQQAGSTHLTAWWLPTDIALPDTTELRAHLAEILPSHLVPTLWARIDALPLTPNGKLDRTRLPTPAPPPPTTTTIVGEHAQPQTETERLIARVWAECLGVTEVSLDDDFFALGGHSLLAVRVVSRLRAALPTGTAGPTVLQVFTHPTVRAQARLCEASDEAEEGLLHRLDRSTGSSRLSVVCFPYAGSSAVTYRSLADAVPDNIALYAVAIPGHDPGRTEATLPLEEVAARSAIEILKRIQGPVALYGHSSGSAFAVETARQLEDAGREVVAVYAGAMFPVALPLGRWRTAWTAVRGDWLATDATYLHGLRASGLDVDATPRRDLHRVIAAIRSDVAEVEAYFTRRLAEPARPLRAPVVSIVGEKDPDTDFFTERHHEWRHFAPATSVVVIAEANHFFAKFRAPDLAEVLAEPTVLPDPTRHPFADDGRPHQASDRWGMPDPRAHQSRPPVRRLSAKAPPEPSLRRFLLVAAGQSASLTGSALTDFAVPLFVLLHTGSVAWFGLLAVLALVPGLLLSPVAGAVVDRFDRRRVMLGADIAAGALEAILLVLLATGVPQTWALCVFVALLSAVIPFQRLAFLSAVPQLVPKHYLGHAAGVVQTGAGVAQFVVPAIAAACFATIGLPGILALDLGTYAVCVITVLFVRFPGTLPFRRRETLLYELREGVRYVLGRRGLWPFVGFFAALNLVLSPLLLLTSPLVLGFGSLADVAVVSTASAVGGILGAVVMTIRGGGRGNPFVACAATAVAMGAAAELAAARPSTFVTALGSAALMACLAAINVRYTVTLQRTVPRRYHGRTFALLGAVAYSTIPLGFGLIAPLAVRIAHAPPAWIGEVLQRSAPAAGTALVYATFGLAIAALGTAVSVSRVAHAFSRAAPDAPPDDLVGINALKRRIADPDHEETP